MTPTYYNETDPYAAEWLRNLIAAGHLPAGDVDERSIVDVRGDDLRGYGACHFFAGIGGWPLALRLAGVPDGAPIWSGSCPCQPFSVAGRGAGTADERHLWPAFHALIAERRPAIVFGEQVASASGRLWLAGVRADLEHVGYAVGAADLAAASVGAPHIRQRLYWLAHAGRFSDERLGGPRDAPREDRGAQGAGDQRERCRPPTRNRGSDGGLAHAERDGGRTDVALRGSERRASPRGVGAVIGGMGDADSRRRGVERVAERGVESALRGEFDGSGAGRRRGGETERMGDAIESGLERHAGHGDRGDEPRRFDALEAGPASASGGAWDEFDLVPFPDGKVRRIEPGVAPLATGVPARVGRLRAYGNAICVPLAAEFVIAGLESIGA